MNNIQWCCSKHKKAYENCCDFNVYNACGYPVFDTNLHMINHYKRINAAKCVVNTSAPRSHELRYKHVSNLNSRYSTPTLLSTSERVPSRTTSNCEVRKRINCNVRLDITPTERSSSVPPRPCTRRNPKNVPQNYIKARKPSPKIQDNINAKKIPIHNETPVSSTASSPKHKPKSKPDKSNKLKVVPIKPPIPAPRQSFASPKKPAVQDYEYLQFSLRITEDIIRNDLYTQKEMRRVFNSHIEANRGRLNMTKMLKQIDHLCKELNISKKLSGNRIIENQTNTERCNCKSKETTTIDKITESVGSTKLSSQTKESSTNSSSQSKESSTNSSSENSKEDILNKVIIGQHEITEEEINELTESDLQEVITKILNNDSEFCSICKREPQMTAEIIDFSEETSKLNTSPVKNNFAIIHTNIENFYSESAENFKTYSTSSGDIASVPSSCDTKHIEQEEQNVDYKEFACSCADDKELKIKNRGQASFTKNQTKTIDVEETDKPKAQTSLEAYDEILKTLLKKFPEKFDEETLHKMYEDQLKLLDICKMHPICTRTKKEIAVQLLSEDKICLLEPMCSGVQPKVSTEMDSKKSDNWSTLDSSAQEIDQNSTEVEVSTKEQDLCFINSVCSSKKDTEKNNPNICVQDPICPGKKTEQKEKHKSEDLCSIDPICSKLKAQANEQTTSNIQPLTKEQIKSKELCSFDPICSKLRAQASEQTNSNDQPSTKEQIISKDLCSIDPVCSKLRAQESQQTNSNDQPPTKEQIKSKDLCSIDPVCSKLKAQASEQTNSNVQPPTEEQIISKDLCSIDPICSKLRAQASEQTNSNDQPSTKEQIKSADLCSIDPVCSKLRAQASEQTNSNDQPPTKEQIKSKDLCSIDPICSKLRAQANEKTCSDVQPAPKKLIKHKDFCPSDSNCSKLKAQEFEQIMSNVQSAIEEQIKSKDLCSGDSTISIVQEQIKSKDLICSKLKSNASEQTASTTKEQVKSNDLCSIDSICSKIKSKASEKVVSDVQPATKDQNESKYLCTSDAICPKFKSKASEQTKDVPLGSSKKLQENEVSIVAQTPPVDNMDSASIKSIAIDNKTTQTSFLVTEKSQPLTKSTFYIDNSSSSKKEEITIVYDKHKSNLDDEIMKKEKEDFISSITKFILDKTFANVKQDSNYSVQSNNSIHSEKQDVIKNEDKSNFVSTVEKLINDRTKDLYQYSSPGNEKSDSQSVYSFAVVADSLDKYRTEYREKYNIPLRKTSVSSKTSDSTISEGQISISSTNVTSVRRINQKIIRKQEPEILEHLKKYEQSKSSSKSNFMKPCVCDYEIKSFTERNYDKYVPKFRRSMFFPTVETQTSNSDLNYKMRYNDNLLSDGEIQHTSSETDDSKTSSSENEISSWR